MTEESRSMPETPPSRNVLARIGWRNVGYLAFVLALIPFGLALEASGPSGPDSGGGVMAAIILWAIVSGLFFLVNAVLAIVGFARNRPVGPALIACALPMLVVILVMLSEAFVPY
jgi:hypothetical protein